MKTLEEIIKERLNELAEALIKLSGRRIKKQKFYKGIYIIKLF